MPVPGRLSGAAAVISRAGYMLRGAQVAVRIGVAVVGWHRGDPAMEFTQSLQQRHRDIPVLDARGGDHHHNQQQAQVVHD
ncbi:hypothetical protein [Streptomyces sp. NPDC059010]|uniref:hypothetical protein n=1 Tax=Streptomyces sp. NPDC059010 TaxID=3346695 RepID=UPI0036B1453C